MRHRVVVIYREITEHMFTAEIEADTFNEAQQKIRNMNEYELEEIATMNWAHDDFIEITVHPYPKEKGDETVR